MARKRGMKMTNPSISREQQASIERALERYFRDRHEDAGPAASDDRTREFVFQMTDWAEDLLRLADLYRDPESHSPSAWREAVSGFLLHAVHHLMRAAELDDSLMDPFGVMKRQSKDEPTDAPQ